MKFNRLSSRSRFLPWTLLCLPVVWVLSMACVLQKLLPKRGQKTQEKEKTARKTLFSWLFRWHLPFHISPFRIIWSRLTQVRLWPFRLRRKKRGEAAVETTPADVSNDISPLNELIDHNIETIISLHMHAELKVSHHQRLLERITAHLGRPRSFYLVLLFVMCWISVNLFARRLGLPTFDPAPFAWLQGLIG